MNLAAPILLSVLCFVSQSALAGPVALGTSELDLVNDKLGQRWRAEINNEEFPVFQLIEMESDWVSAVEFEKPAFAVPAGGTPDSTNVTNIARVSFNAVAAPAELKLSNREFYASASYADDVYTDAVTYWTECQKLLADPSRALEPFMLSLAHPAPTGLQVDLEGKAGTRHAGRKITFNYLREDFMGRPSVEQSRTYYSRTVLKRAQAMFTFAVLSFLANEPGFDLYEIDTFNAGSTPTGLEDFVDDLQGHCGYTL